MGWQHCFSKQNIKNTKKLEPENLGGLQPPLALRHLRLWLYPGPICSPLVVVAQPDKRLQIEPFCVGVV